MGIWYVYQVDRGFSHPPRFHSHYGLPWDEIQRQVQVTKQVGKNSYPSELAAKPEEVHYVMYSPLGHIPPTTAI